MIAGIVLVTVAGCAGSGSTGGQAAPPPGADFDKLVPEYLLAKQSLRPIER
ncbi:hypothetical protein [Alloactinosynnema sp. L-07]|uniref:hypothetical protein n=1 Tax=Alloactinosynnema sp. L-07 TaxID=1653480 RepID=UPI00065EFDA2|nr:hypothetical protein [Alloactinosynnema sp. L-07]CRK58874.1 hypothetical protein [Alloactinosynnema sp. L-07]